MGWKAICRNAGGTHGRRSAGRWFVAGVVALLLLSLAVAFVPAAPETRKAAPPPKRRTAARRASERPPSVAKAVRGTAGADSSPAPAGEARPVRVGESVNGYVMLPSGRLHRRRGVVTNSVVERVKAPYAIFEHSCENEIACLLSLRPGDFLLGTPRYGGRFKEDFLKSLEKPIAIAPDDSEKDRALKEAVIAAKRELADALARGEDVERIMADARAELQDLMLYKMKMRRQFNDLRRECGSDEDVGLYFEACNKMLEERGIAPIRFGPITKRNLLLQNGGR